MPQHVRVVPPDPAWAEGYRRERALLSKVGQEAGEELADYVQSMYRTIMAASRSYENGKLGRGSKVYDGIKKAMEETPQLFPQRPTVACQGIEGAYSQIACDRLFKAPSILYFQSFDHVFKAVESGMCQYGILPIENSTAGSVNAVYDLMIRHNFSIVRSARLKVSHNLLAKPGTKLEDIRDVYSHEQALHQCADYLAGLKNVAVHVVENTAVAARMVAQSDRSDVAALSSRFCAEQYDLEIVQDNVQDQDNNYTRFICITKDMQVAENASVISVMLSISNEPGSLSRILNKFFLYGLDMTKIESRPIRDGSFDVVFHIDFKGNLRDRSIAAFLNDLCKSCRDFKLLGNAVVMV